MSWPTNPRALTLAEIAALPEIAQAPNFRNAPGIPDSPATLRDRNHASFGQFQAGAAAFLLKTAQAIPLSVTEFGAVGDGVTDDAPAFAAAIAAAPAIQSAWSSLTRSALGTVIAVPSPPVAYRFASTVEIPSTRQILIQGPSPHSSRIVCDEGVDYAFRIMSGQRATGIRQLLFHRGGIEIQTNVRLHTDIRDCWFESTPDYAIATIGMSVISVEIAMCFFSDCAGSINIAFSASDLVYIKRCSFIRGHTAPSIRTNTTGVVVEDCDFETRVSASSAQPYLHMEGLNEGRCLIRYNRFGDESFPGFGPPVEAIRIGPMGDSIANAMVDVLIEGNDFAGTNGTPSDTEGTHAVTINQPVRGLRFVDNRFATEYYGPLINESYADLSNGREALSTSNVWRGNVVAGGAYDVFSHGGITFGGVLAPESQRATQNMLQNTEDLAAAGWTLTNATATKDATGPGDVASSAYTLEKLEAGGASTRGLPNLLATGGPIVFSVWMRAGTHNYGRIAIRDNDNSRWLTGLHTPIQLTSRWVRYHVVAPNPAVGANLSPHILFGVSGTAATGTIEFAAPQMEHGSLPTEYVETVGATVRTPRQFGDLVLGARVVGYGSAAPVSGRHQVGDRVVNTAPVAGAPEGWACTVAGTPGTWVVTGQLGYRTATGAPSVNANFVGEELIDTSNGGWYKAITVGSGADDWVHIGGGTPS